MRLERPRILVYMWGPGSRPLRVLGTTVITFVAV